jgi:hypothetical protein
MKPRFILFCFFSALAGVGLLGSPAAFAGRSYEVESGGKQYEPKELKAWSGDTVRICNQGIYGRQPYSKEKYNKFGSRNADNLEMLWQGKCREIQLRNPTNNILKVVIRDAVNERAKLVIQVWQASGN